MSMNDVCRLCLAHDNLVWIFDKRFQNSENMKEVVYITTGVEIYMKDLISQKICKKCCQVAIKMFQFRTNSLKNDKFLKDQCKEYLKNTKMKIPNTSVTIKSDKSVGKEEEKKEVKPATYRIHPSVTDLFKSYPQIKLPTICLKSHIAPCVSMTMDAVENYFKSRNLDFRKCTQLVLRSNRTAKKKTMAISAKSNTSKYSEKLVPSKTNKSDSDMSGNNVVTTSKKENRISENVAPVSSKDEKVQPISIKISEAKDSFKIVDISAIKNANIPDASDIANVEDNLNFTINNIPSNDIEDTSKSKKRKISETDFPNTREAKKPDFIESLGLAPTQKNAPLAINANDETPATLSYLGKSVPLFICDICNSVQYNARDLKKHHYRHLRCQFCRTRFKTMELKTLHIENSCIVKMTMNNLPTIPLGKIEYDIGVRRTYPDAFIDFAAIPGLYLRTEETLNTEHPISSSPDSTKSKQLLNILTGSVQPVTGSVQRHIPEENSTTEVIEILSDEEEPTKKTTNEPNKNNLSMDPPAKEVIGKPFPNSENVSTQLPNSNLPLQDNVVYNTVSIVKPDLKIRNSCILDNLDPKGTDIKILKELLRHRKNLDLQVNIDTQTELPTNDLIFVNRRDLTTDLKNLKHQLHVYKIPVIIKNGTFQVSYEHCVTSKTPKNMCLWNNLIPIDITINSETVESNGTTIPLNHGSSPLRTDTVSDSFNTVPETASVNATNQLPNNVFPTNSRSETTGNTPKTASKNLISTSSHLNTSSIPPISSTVNLLTNTNIPIIYSGNIVSDKHCPSSCFSSASTLVSNSSTSIIAKENTPPPLSLINNSSINRVLVQSISCTNAKTNLNSEWPTSSPSISETNYTDTSLVGSVASSANQLVAVSNSMNTYTPPCSIISSANQVVAKENIVVALSHLVNNSKNYFGPFGGMSTSLLPPQASVVNSALTSVTMNNSMIINSVQETRETILLPTVASVSPITTTTTEPSNHLTSPIINTVASENNVPNVNDSATSSSFIIVGTSPLESAATTISNSQVTDGLANRISELCNTTQINHQLIASNSLVTSPKLIASNPLVPNKDTSPTASLDCPPVLPTSTTLPADTSNVIMPGIIKVRNVWELMEDGHSNII